MTIHPGISYPGWSNSSPNDSRDQKNLFGCLIKLIDAFCWLACLNAECRRASCTLLRENTLCLSYGGNCLSVASKSLIGIPGDSVIAAP